VTAMMCALYYVETGHISIGNCPREITQMSTANNLSVIDNLLTSEKVFRSV